MIIDFEESFNTYDEKILNNYGVFDYVCPTCGAKHSFIRHGTYERNICFAKDYKVTETTIVVLRLFCKSCEKTHAILPNDVVPYCIYSFSFMLDVLIEKVINLKKISEICDGFNISFQLIFNFVDRFIKFANSCQYVLINLGVLNNSGDFKEILTSLLSYEKNNHDFSIKYFFYSSWPFLMLKFQNILPCPIYVGGTG